MFQVIVLPHVRKKYMNHHVAVVHSHPLGILQPHHVSRFLTMLKACKVTY